MAGRDQPAPSRADAAEPLTGGEAATVHGSVWLSKFSQTYVGLGRTPIPNGPAVTPAPVSIIKNHMWRQYRPGRLLHHCAAMRALLCASLKAGKVALLSGRVGPTCRSGAAAGMLPWARALAVLYTTRMAAWTPSLGLRGLFLAALPQSQNQIKSNGERFHVIRQ